MACNHLEEELESVRVAISMLRLKSENSSSEEKLEIADRIMELEHEEKRLLKDLGVKI